MAALTVTVTDVAGETYPDALVRVYAVTANGFTPSGEDRTDVDGVATFDVPDGRYVIHVDPISGMYGDQWLGGGETAFDAQVFAITGGGDLNFVLQRPMNPGEVENRAIPLFWYDTTADEILILYPGQERAAMNDRTSPIYQHVLAGPFLSRADVTETIGVS